MDTADSAKKGCTAIWLVSWISPQSSQSLKLPAPTVV
jgi:hypothetical protein